MPSRSRTRNQLQRRNRFRRRRFRRRAIRSGIPLRMTRRLTHVWRWSINPLAGGALAVNNAKLNSIHDPSGDMGTGQPLTHDQWVQLYRKYIVLGWSLKIEVVTADNTTPMMLGFTPLNTSTYLTDYRHYKEFPQTVSRMVTPDMDKTVLVARGGVKRYLSPGGSFRNDSTVQGNVGADPTRILYGHLWVQATDQAADLGQVDFVVTMTQLVTFFDPDTVARS